MLVAIGAVLFVWFGPMAGIDGVVTQWVKLNNWIRDHALVTTFLFLIVVTIWFLLLGYEVERKHENDPVIAQHQREMSGVRKMLSAYRRSSEIGQMIEPIDAEIRRLDAKYEDIGPPNSYSGPPPVRGSAEWHNITHKLQQMDAAIGGFCRTLGDTIPRLGANSPPDEDVRREIEGVSGKLGEIARRWVGVELRFRNVKNDAIRFRTKLTEERRQLLEADYLADPADG
jgi:hypothetical protein